MNDEQAKSLTKAIMSVADELSELRPEVERLRMAVALLRKELVEV